MNRYQLEHLIRAACSVADITEIIIVGSQSVLGQFPEASGELTRSLEADVFSLESPAKADLIDGAIGEKSVFDETFGYYAHGVGRETAILPEGAFERLVPVCNENTRGLKGLCLEVHDLAVSKLIAGREKDLAFVECLLREGMADGALMAQRLTETILEPARAELARARLKRIRASL